MKALIFSGQGTQKHQMGKDLYEKFPVSRKYFDTADEILGYKFSDVLFNAPESVLMDTRYAQMGIFLYEIALAKSQNDIIADCVAGHSLGEYAALVYSGVLDFEETVNFIKKRGEIFYNAFDRYPSVMGAIIGLDETLIQREIDKICSRTENQIYIANYNGPGQVVITGERNLVKELCKILKSLGAKRALILPMKGVGHSPNSAFEGELIAKELKKLHWKSPVIPIYQDVDALPHTLVEEIIDNQLKLMTHPVQWTKIIRNMITDSVNEFYECGTDDTLQKIVRRMSPDKLVSSLLHVPTYEGKIKDYSY